MIFRNYLGLDVTSGELRAVALRRRGKGTRLLGARTMPLPAGVIQPTVREPNVLDPKRFGEAVQEILQPLAGREDRVALSLPEASGRLLLVEAETAFKTRQEGIEILKWQMKGSLPAEPREVRIDYQVLDRTESGRYRLAVVLMTEAVLRQYEDLVAAAGFSPAVIDFHCLNLYNYYRPRLDPGDSFVLVGVEQGTLSLQYFQDRILSFHRCREVAADPLRIYQELNRSLVSCQETFPAFRRAAVFLHCDWESDAALMEALHSAFERGVIVLNPNLDKLADSAPELAAPASRGLVAAIGAAERMM